MASTVKHASGSWSSFWQPHAWTQSSRTTQSVPERVWCRAVSANPSPRLLTMYLPQRVRSPDCGRHGPCVPVQRPQRCTRRARINSAKSLCVAIVMINCNCCHRMHEHTLAAAHVCQCHQGSWWSHHVCTSLNLWGRHQTHQPARRSGWRTQHHTLPHAGGAKVFVSRLAPWTAQPQRKTTSSIVSGCSMLRAMARCAL